MDLKELTHQAVLDILPDRAPDAHKGRFGKVLLLCGSTGYTGSAALAAMGALRSGAGLVYLGVPESIYAIEAVKLLEPIVFPVPDNRGMFCERSFSAIETMLDQMDAVLIGPGIGRSEGTFSFLKYVLESYTGPLVLDADGISLMAEHKDILRGRKAPTVMTPHEGEFSRFMALKPDRLTAAMELAAELGLIVVLKGRGTVVTNGSVAYRNPTGNPGMAVGGSGDVLAGMVLSLIGQGVSPLEASACAVWLHGAAGDLCAKELGQYAMLPSDMLHALPRLLK